jgi:3-deoxy-D-manno-octulosonate 8-phosphate phosphatase KdsC-like HAD superfamily phosphatase
MSNFKSNLHKIKAFAFDVDGVFTDGLVLATETGDLLRSHNAKDGFAVRIAVLKNYPVAIITGGSSQSIKKRFLQVGIREEDIIKCRILMISAPDTGSNMMRSCIWVTIYRILKF